MQLILGTVQFGLAYGVAGRSTPIPEAEIRRILALAYEGGIRLLDTAAAYGDIESRLDSLCGGRDFRIVSKFPRVPPELSPEASAAWVLSQADTSHRRLGERLQALLAHDADDLSGERGRSIGRALGEWSIARAISCGASTYGPQPCRELHEALGFRHFQFPANAMDQRIGADFPTSDHGLELHVRSVFLQGLLLMPEETAAARVPRAAAALSGWHRRCRELELAPLPAALSIAKGFVGAQGVVVGVDSAPQLEEILRAWHDVPALLAPELSCEDDQVTDPRRWAGPTSNREPTSP